jgi:nucleoside kinase
VILAVGTLSFDLIGSTELAFRNDSLTVLLDEIRYSNGGRGANFAVFAQALNVSTALCSSVGEDFRGSAYESDLQARQVDLGLLFWNPSSDTPRVFAFSNRDDARVFVLRDRRQQSERTYCDWVVRHTRAYKYDVLYCTSEVPIVNCAALEASSAELRVFAPGHDLFYYDGPILLRCLRAADIVFANEAEAHAMKSIISTDFDEVRRMLQALVVTRGARGCTVYTGASSVDIDPALPARVVDPTGAGDAYAAGFVVGFLRCHDFLRSAEVGNAVASLAIESLGCQTSVPTVAEVSLRLANSYHGYGWLCDTELADAEWYSSRS